MRLMRPVCSWARRRPLLALLAGAFAVRAVVAVAIALADAGSRLAPDSQSYVRIAADVSAGRALEPYPRLLYHQTALLLWPVAQLFRVFGAHALVGQLFVALVGSVAAYLTARVALEVLPMRWALVSGGIVALLPSAVVWSSLVLKDAMAWACLSGIAGVLALTARGRGARRLLGWAAIAALIAGLAATRMATAVEAMLAASVALLAVARLAVWRRLAIAAAAALLLPWALGFGPAGVAALSRVESPALRRALNAEGARTAVVAPPASVLARSPTVSAMPAEAAVLVGTGGRRRLLLRGVLRQFLALERAPATAPAGAPPDTVGRELVYLPKGLAVVLLRPFPWQVGAVSGPLRLASLEALLWYPLLALACLGIGPARRQWRVLLFPLLMVGASVVTYALSEGNLGTAYRHRCEFLWALALLAGRGAQRVSARCWAASGPRAGARWRVRGRARSTGSR
jgi:hypothetical protein